MADENLDQEAKPQSLSDFMDLGQKDGAFSPESKKEAKPEKETPEPKQETKATDAKADDECKDCSEAEKAERAKAKKKEPYKIIKVGGRDYAVESEEEALALMQKGVDYTQKTQDVAEQRKEVDKKAETVEALSKKFDGIWKAIDEEDGIKNITTTTEGEQKSPEEIKNALYKTLELDPDITETETLKIVDYLAKIEAKNENLEQRNKQTEGIVKLFLADKAQANLVTIIEKTAEEFPVEKVLDDKGNNLTALQIVQTMFAKSQEPANKKAKKTLPELAVEAVKQIHSLQKSGNKDVPKLPDKVTRDELEKRYPDIFKEAKEYYGGEAVASYMKEMKETAPASATARTTVSDTKRDSGKITGIRSAFDKYHKDRGTSP